MSRHTHAKSIRAKSPIVDDISPTLPVRCSSIPAINGCQPVTRRMSARYDMYLQRVTQLNRYISFHHNQHNPYTTHTHSNQVKKLARILTIRYREMHVANKAVALDFDAGLRGLHAAYEYLCLRGCPSPPGFNQALCYSLPYDEQAREIHGAVGAPACRDASRAPLASYSWIGISCRGRCAATVYPRKFRPSSGTRATSCLGCITTPDMFYVQTPSRPARQPDHQVSADIELCR